MAIIRFAVKAPQPSDLELSAVPALFTRRVWDIDDSTPEGAARAGRMRYVGPPHGVIELGVIDTSGVVTT